MPTGNSPPHPTLSRESTDSSATITQKTDSWPSKLTSQTSATSAASSAQASPLQSREPSPTRPLPRSTTNSRSSSVNAAIHSRKNSTQDLSPARSGSQTNTSPLPPASKTLSSANIPTLHPSTAAPSSNAGAPVKSPTSMEHLRDSSSPRWPISPRLRSPPPMLHKSNLVQTRRLDQQETPLIALQRPTPPQPQYPDPQSDTDTDDAHISQGLRTPARGGGGSTSTLETVQEVSPLGSPRGPDDSSLAEILDDSMISEASQSDLVGLGLSSRANDSGSDDGSIRTARRSDSNAASVPPPLTSRQSSTSVNRPGMSSKSKTGDLPLQSMTVETETVTSIPQAALAPNTGVQVSNGSLRTKPSNETIRPKKKEKRSSRKQPAVTTVNGEKPSSTYSPPRSRHPMSMMLFFSADTEKRRSPPSGSSPDGSPPGRFPWNIPKTRRQSIVMHHLSNMNSLLTGNRTASSKADIFEAKVASAVEEANSSDSEETFVYDSNPPDARERPQRFHSRTPSATSMASQLDRNGMRSIHTVMESTGPPMAVKKSMKFVNTYSANSNLESIIGEEDGRGSSRSNAGSARGTARHHHHFGRWGHKGGGNGHPSIFTEHSPFSPSASSGHGGSRHSSNPPSPRYSSRPGVSGKRVTHLSTGYDLDDPTTTADDERTPLIQSSTIRSSRSARRSRGMHPHHSLRSMEAQTYRSPPSVLNRFASCLVLTVMLLLVVSGAIGFMFATSQPLTDITLVSMTHVVASQQELMLDLTVSAHNPNVVVVVVDSADIEVFAKSPRALSDSEWWRHTHPGEIGPPPPKGVEEGDQFTSLDDSPDDPPPDDSAPNMRLGTITGFNSALSFEGSFFHSGNSTSTGEVRLKNPGNGTYGGQERWERILEAEFQLILKGVLKYTLPLSQRVRTATISGKVLVKPNAANDPTLKPVPSLDGGDEFTISL